VDVHGLTTASAEEVAPPIASALGGRRRDVVLAVVGLVALGLLLALVLAHLGGTRTFVVRTASMGTTAPVGTLVVTSSVSLDEVVPGDVVTFRPPGRDGTTFTHRVVAAETGGLTTRGDASEANDPWALGDVELVGRAGLLVPGAGWIVRGLPMLIAGGVLVGGLSSLVTSRPHRSAVRVVGATLVFSVVSVVLQPFTAATVLSTASDPTGGAGGVATVVSTGVLPVKLSTAQGAWTVLSSGQVGDLSLPAADAGSGALISLAPHLSPLGWVGFVVLCALPLFWCTSVGLTPAPTTGRRAVTA
jgi:signal peptidase I